MYQTNESRGEARSPGDIVNPEGTGRSRIPHRRLINTIDDPTKHERRVLNLMVDDVVDIDRSFEDARGQQAVASVFRLRRLSVNRYLDVAMAIVTAEPYLNRVTIVRTSLDDRKAVRRIAGQKRGPDER